MCLCRLSLRCSRNAFPKTLWGSARIKSSRMCHTVFSGIQPTGAPHLGNYFGAIRNWVDLQKSCSCIFCIVDLHSVTLPQDPNTLKKNIHLMAASLIACGIDPEVSTLFLQSQVPEHAELSWLLGCLTTLPRLNHLPQFKEKSKQVKDVPLGLYVYPVLQSADILLYKATKVPVGEDQLQHIQLTQHLARLFNNRFKKIFPLPEPLLSEKCARIKSLRQPDKKMSKSDSDPKSRIELTDDPDTVRENIKKAMTDFTSAVTFEPENRPGISNLIFIHSLCTGLSPEDICEQSRHMDTGQYKLVVADAVIEYLKPINTRIKELLSDHGHLESVLRRGRDKASEIAQQTSVEVREAMGLSSSSTL